MAEIGITQTEARTIVEDVLDHVFESLARGEDVQITNFGRFELRKRDERTMDNPKTGETHTIPPRYVVHFTPSNSFKKRFSDE